MFYTETSGRKLPESAAAALKAHRDVPVAMLFQKNKSAACLISWAGFLFYH